MLPQVSAQARNFGETKFKSSLREDDELLEKL